MEQSSLGSSNPEILHTKLTAFIPLFPFVWIPVANRWAEARHKQFDYFHLQELLNFNLVLHKRMQFILETWKTTLKDSVVRVSWLHTSSSSK